MKIFYLTSCVLATVFFKSTLADSYTTYDPTCGPGYSQFGTDGLNSCIEDCPSGWHSSGLICVEDCRSGYHDDGLSCSSPPKDQGSDRHDCPWYDLCGVTLARGCTSCPDGWKNLG